MSWITWSPFQSDDVKAICAHMTPQEEQAGIAHGAVAGVFIVISVVAPIGMFLLSGKGIYGAALAIVAFATVWLFGARRLIRQQKEHLCSTEWAKQQGYDPDSLRTKTF